MVCVCVRWADRTRTRLTVDCRPHGPVHPSAGRCSLTYSRRSRGHSLSWSRITTSWTHRRRNRLTAGGHVIVRVSRVLALCIAYCVRLGGTCPVPCPEPFLMVQVESVPARVATRWARLSQPHVALVCAQGLASSSFPPECKATAQLELPFAVVYGTARACERVVEEGKTSISPTCAPTLHTSSTSQQRGGDANNGISVGLLIRNKPSKAAGAPVGLFVYVSRFAVEHS
jgi:hypothetical protein